MRGRSRERSDRVEEQAVHRLTAILENPSPAAEAELAEWIARDPAHGVAFARAEAAWEASARLAQGEQDGDGDGASEADGLSGPAAPQSAPGLDSAPHPTCKDIARGTG